MREEGNSVASASMNILLQIDTGILGIITMEMRHVIFPLVRIRLELSLIEINLFPKRCPQVFCDSEAIKGSLVNFQITHFSIYLSAFFFLAKLYLYVQRFH